MNGKYISCQEIIRNVFRDNGYTLELKWQDAIEWSAEAVELIGAPAALSPKQERIVIEDYRGILPCDLYYINQAAGSFNGCRPFAMRGTTNSFHPVLFCDANKINNQLISSTSVTRTAEPIGEDISGNPVFTFQNGNMSLNSNGVDININGTEEATYSLNDNYIFTSYKEGYVWLAYWAFPIDKEGFPLIPDNIKFKQAVQSFIRWKIDYILWRKNDIERAVYDKSEQEWLWYCGAAQNAARIPNKDQMENWKNMLRLIPQKYQHSNFFKTLGS